MDLRVVISKASEVSNEVMVVMNISMVTVAVWVREVAWSGCEWMKTQGELI